MCKKDNKKNNKFDKVKSYKDLNDEETKENYLEVLSLQILSTINEMKNLDCEYKKYETNFSRMNNSQILNLSFNELKTLLWTRFCVQMRDYSETIFFLLDKSESKCKYEKVNSYIKNTNFISTFYKGKDEKEEYDAISLTLHNLNRYNYGQEKWDKSFEKYTLFNKVIVENDIKTIKNEFEIVIQKFRIAEKFECCNVGLEYTEWSPIYKLIEFLSK